MRQIGVVERTQGNQARVRIQRASACGENCASCGAGCRGSKTVVDAYMAVPCEPGEHVVIEMSGAKVMGAAALVYVIPLLLLIAGYFLGAGLFHTEAAGIAGGFILMVLGFGGIRLIDRRAAGAYRHTIVKNLGEGPRKK